MRMCVLSASPTSASIVSKLAIRMLTTSTITLHALHVAFIDIHVAVALVPVDVAADIAEAADGAVAAAVAVAPGL